LEDKDRGFLYFWAMREGLGVAPWRKGARAAATRVIEEFNAEHGSCDMDLAEGFLKESLHSTPPQEWTSTLRASMLELRGWAGMFKNMDCSFEGRTSTYQRDAPPKDTGG
jgi:hypothetical protein